MKKVVLYTAVSLDGCIARDNGSIDWLEEFPNPDKVDHGYQDFISGVDTLVMGSATYRQVIGFGIEWPYKERCFVVTRDNDLKVESPNTFLLDGHNVETEIAKLKEETGKNIWLVGGGKLNTTFMKLGLIDEMILSVIPIVIGGGILLFPGNTTLVDFKLTENQQFNTGIINLYYSKAN